jgi:hypothetical protein
VEAPDCPWSAFCGGPIPDFAPYIFNHGDGKRVKNNVNRAFNNDEFYAASIWYNENYQGAVDTFYPGEARQLIPSVRNNNASMSYSYAGG